MAGMQKYFLELGLHLLILAPFIFLCLKDRSKVNIQRFFVFLICYFVNSVFLALPKFYPFFDIIKGGWNWDGKIYGTLGGIAAYFLFRGLFKENDFFTFRQNRHGLKSALWWAGVMVVFSSILHFVVGGWTRTFDYETLAFQISLPGIDEEINIRGILLGLLVSSLREKISFWGNPAILLTSILFGFGHALSLDGWAVKLNPLYFLYSGFVGYILGWIALKSRSLLLPILSHNLFNFFGTLVSMIK